MHVQRNPVWMVIDGHGVRERLGDGAIVLQLCPQLVQRGEMPAVDVRLGPARYRAEGPPAVSPGGQPDG